MWYMRGAYNAKWSSEVVPVLAGGVRCVESVVFTNENLVIANLGYFAVDVGTYVLNFVRFWA